MQTKLVTRGDDIGMCVSVNRAIIDAWEHGVLRNASLLATGPAFADAVKRLRNSKGLCIGLHACLTSEWGHLRWGPVLGADKVPSLVAEEGHFFPTLERLRANEPEIDEAAAEIEAQLEKARDADVEITYLDEHMWVSETHPELCERMEDLACREGLLCNSTLVREGKIVKLPKPEGHRHRDESGTVKSLKMSAPRTYYLVGHPAYRTAEMEAAHLAWQAPGKGEKARLRNEERLMYMGREIVALARSGGFLPIAYSEIG